MTDAEKFTSFCEAASVVGSHSDLANHALSSGGHLRGQLAVLRDRYDEFRLCGIRIQGADVPDTYDNLERLLGLRINLQRARRANVRVRAWLEAMSGDDALADFMLGVSWDRKRDAVVIFGDGCG